MLVNNQMDAGKMYSCTFMMSNDSSRNLELPTRGQIACSGLQEEEGLLGYGIVQFLDVVCIVATNCDDLLNVLRHALQILCL
jgi:hypothetical protein